MITRQTVRSLENKLNKAAGAKQELFIWRDCMICETTTYTLNGKSYNSKEELEASGDLDPQIKYHYIGWIGWKCDLSCTKK